jgi:hypothetical protein
VGTGVNPPVVAQSSGSAVGQGSLAVSPSSGAARPPPPLLNIAPPPQGQPLPAPLSGAGGVGK